MKFVLLLVLISLIKGEDAYVELISEKVSEEYCNQVINNMTAILNEGYVYLDFLKSPKQPEGYDDYIPKVDLISELNSINKKNRTFYDFYRDIENVLEKTRDGHFNIYARITPNNFLLNSSYFCIPFLYSLIETNDEKGEVNGAYLSIEPNDACKEGYTNETLNKIIELKGKKIISINNIEPYEYFDEMSKKGRVIHSPQARFIYIRRSISQFSVQYYPFKKEELNISIKFEGVDETLDIEYQFVLKKYLNTEFEKYYADEQKRYLKHKMPFPTFDEIEKKYKIKKGLLNEKSKNDKDIWDLKSKGGNLKCKVDEDNKLNVFYQNSFSPEDFEDYEKVMYECFKNFYSNDYKLIIIEDQNGGGYSELCIPFTQYVRPKILKPEVTSMRSSNLIYKNFFINDENLNPETCFPYTEKDNILDGIKDQYSEEVFHQRTKNIESFNIYEKKIMELKRREYLDLGKVKKPTEIIVFTDGFSFSCTSVFIKGLQVHGAAILVGYNSRPDLVDKKYDASQSNSAVETFSFSEYIQNLEKLGFNSRLTFSEEFDPNDKGNPKTPMEFLIYPVDEVSNIYLKYDDDKYDRFIKEAKSIFDKYNDLENGECNPNNTFLFYETSECDSKLGIDKAHGGYLCGSNGKWDKNQCIVAYCDKGYILNDEKNKCIEDPCNKITLKEISINEGKDLEFIIEPNNTYIFKIEKENYEYYFNSKLEKLFYFFNQNHILESVNKETKFKKNDKIYVNYYVNITENQTIKITAEKADDDFPNWAVLLITLISLGLCLCFIFFVVIYISFRRNKLESEFKDKIENLNQI